MSKNFENLITLVKVSNGAPGQSGASKYEVLTSAEKIGFYYNESGDLTVSPLIVNFGIRYSNSKQSIELNSENTSLLILSLDNKTAISDNDDIIQYLSFSEIKDDKEETVSYIASFQIYNFLFNMQSRSEFLLSFQYENEEDKVTHNILVENIIPAPLFSLTQHLYGMSAAIRDTKMGFDENGLTIQNGGLTIKGADGITNLLEFEKGNLKITGIINAEEGGSIGGFNIKTNCLESKAQENGESIIRIWGENNDDPTKNGLIEAKKITIGKDARIESYIQLGNGVQLLNPESRTDNSFIIAQGLSMTSEGKIKLGGDEGIELYGSSDSNSVSYIRSGKPNNLNWEISGEGTAYFRDIKASNLILNNAILETGSTQAVGSSMIYCPSYSIEECKEVDSGIEIKISSESNPNAKLDEETWIYVNGQYLKVESYNENTGTYICKGAVENITEGMIVANLGKSKRKDADEKVIPGDCVLLAFGGQANIPKFSENNSIVFAEIVEDKSNQIDFNKKIILGDLGANGFGLYGENVFLKGRLTTQVDTATKTYAGINTMNDEGYIEGQGNIVFWAGAEDENNVKEAPFYVTDQGFLQAQNANIMGSTFSGTIIASEIKAAKIRGSAIDDSSSGTLTILDAAENKGIIFAKTIETKDAYGNQITEEKPIFSIGSNGMRAGTSENMYYFIRMKDDKASFECVDGSKRIMLDGASASLKLNYNENNCLSIQNNSHNEGAFFVGEKEIVSFETDKIKIKSSFHAHEDVDFGQGRMIYKPVDNGYNLYIN